MNLVDRYSRFAHKRLGYDNISKLIDTVAPLWLVDYHNEPNPHRWYSSSSGSLDATTLRTYTSTTAVFDGNRITLERL